MSLNISWSVLDTQMMSRAIQLARKGFYTTRPNPSVGCVIVKDNQIIGIDLNNCEFVKEKFICIKINKNSVFYWKIIAGK